MNAANPDNSERLQRVLALMRDGVERTTLEIATGAQVCAVNSCVDELREAGYNIPCQRRGRYWYYRMITEPEQLELIA